MVVKGSKNVIAARMDVEQIYASVSRQILSATAGAIPIPVSRVKFRISLYRCIEKIY